jgi:four helix bundle protein
MAYVKSFRDLDVYKLSRDVSKEIYSLSIHFPKEEKYSLTDQIRRSSRSVGAQIAEAWGKRRYELHFISKLTDADGEQLETQHWFEVAEECQYLELLKRDELLRKCESLGKMLQNMIDKSSTFVGNHDTDYRLLITEYQEFFSTSKLNTSTKYHE